MLDPDISSRLRMLRKENIPEPVDIILFLGAGASKPFGYPTSDEFVGKLQLDNEERSFIGGFPTIDEVMRYLDGLISGEKSYRRLLGSIVEPDKMDKLDKEVKKASRIREKIIGGIFEEYSYRDIADNYLDKYIQLLRKENGDHLPVFTTNYDPTVENLVEKKGYKVNTLFEHEIYGVHQWRGQEAFTGKESNVIHLFKLHGSIYWYKREEGLVEERTRRKVVRPEEEIIFPGMTVGDKRNSDPYITYWDYFDVYLTQAKRAIFLGYRFDDREILELLKEKTFDKIIIVNPEKVKVGLENVVVINKQAQDGVKDVEEELRGATTHNDTHTPLVSQP